LRLCAFASKKKKETRTKRQETSLPTGRQETRGKSREEIELFAVRFLCACLPRQTGLCAFASKKKKETCLPQAGFFHLASTIEISISEK
jgi:hypothetical protein